MLPIERQHRIRELIEAKKTMKITELSEHLGVSGMTVHRDLKPLIKEGLVVKTFGGVSLAKSKTVMNTKSGQCVYYKNKIKNRYAYHLILQNNQIENTCCPHCGIIRQAQLGHQVIQALAHDFLTETTISAHLSWFVLDSSLHTGCCHPNILAFQLKDHADKFIKGFGGEIYTYDEVAKKLFNT